MGHEAHKVEASVRKARSIRELATSAAQETVVYYLGLELSAVLSLLLLTSWLAQSLVEYVEPKSRVIIMIKLLPYVE